MVFRSSLLRLVVLAVSPAARREAMPFAPSRVSVLPRHRLRHAAPCPVFSRP
jgi:hypothetical protein